MATLLQAVATYRPRIKGAARVDLAYIAARLEVGTLVTRPIAQMVLDELVRLIEDEVERGTKVTLGSLGTFGADVRMDGSLRPTFRYAAGMRRRLSAVRIDRSRLTNRACIGMDADAVKARWDAEHPEDPVELGVRGRRAEDDRRGRLR